MTNRWFSALIATAVVVSDPAWAGAEPPYFDPGQYTAALHQHSHRWQLLPLDGGEVEVIERSPVCVSQLHVPRGVWVVTRDEQGIPLLLAPSAIRLPQGFPAPLRLTACSADDTRTGLPVPPIVFEWISRHVGSVMIDD